MGTLSNPGLYNCLSRAEPDEPLFHILGRDRMGPSLVDIWALARRAEGEDAAVVNDAFDVASSMRNWLYLSKKRETKVLELIPLEILRAEVTRREIIEQNALLARSREAQARRSAGVVHANGHTSFDDSEGGAPE